MTIVEGSSSRLLAHRPKGVARSLPHRITVAALRTVVPVILFGRYQRFAYLVPTASPRMLVGDDWTTYLVSPNYLRGSAFLTWPLARVPGYIAPDGTSLGQTDIVPVLTPLYRALLQVLPGKPVQIVGFLLLFAYLASYFLCFNFVQSFTKRHPWWVRELAAASTASIIVIAPFWNLQYVHPALMQQWVLIWAVIGSLRRCFNSQPERARTARWSTVPVLVSAVLQPYLIPMTAAICLGPDLALVRLHPLAVIKKWTITIFAALFLAFALGYIESGSNLGSDGFGSYASDLVALVDPDNQSNILPNIATTPGAIGGYAYPGMGALMLLFSAVVTGVLRPFRSRSDLAGKEAEPDEFNGDPVSHHGRARFVGLLAVVFLTGVFAIGPAIRIRTRKVLDVSRITDHVSSLTAVFRVNGRFVWVTVWFILLLSIAHVCQIASSRFLSIGLPVFFILQLFDVVPWTPLLRANGSIEYDAARSTLTKLKSGGIETIQFIPPVLIPGCYR
jgi:Family of unknown function (DUF6311)